MAFAEWTSELRVGIEQIDSSHQRFIDTLNGLFASLSDPRGRDNETESLQKLVTLIEYEVGLEEGLLAGHKYPNAVEHFRLHEDFLVKLLEAQWEHENGKQSLNIGGLRLLRDMLIRDIINSDKSLVTFLNPNGPDTQ